MLTASQLADDVKYHGKGGGASISLGTTVAPKYNLK
jgi:hypothetical protein